MLDIMDTTMIGIPATIMPITQIPTISLITVILTITHTQSTTLAMEHTTSTLMESTLI